MPFQFRLRQPPSDLSFLSLVDGETLFNADEKENGAVKEATIQQIGWHAIGLPKDWFVSTRAHDTVARVIATLQCTVQYLAYCARNAEKQEERTARAALGYQQERDDAFEELVELRQLVAEYKKHGAAVVTTSSSRWATQTKARLGRKLEQYGGRGKEEREPYGRQFDEEGLHCSLCGNHYPTMGSLESHLRKRHHRGDAYAAMASAAAALAQQTALAAAPPPVQQPDLLVRTAGATGAGAAGASSTLPFAPRGAHDEINGAVDGASTTVVAALRAELREVRQALSHLTDLRDMQRSTLRGPAQAGRESGDAAAHYHADPVDVSRERAELRVALQQANARVLALEKEALLRCRDGEKESGGLPPRPAGDRRDPAVAFSATLTTATCTTPSVREAAELPFQERVRESTGTTSSAAAMATVTTSTPLLQRSSRDALGDVAVSPMTRDSSSGSPSPPHPQNPVPPLRFSTLGETRRRSQEAAAKLARRAHRNEQPDRSTKSPRQRRSSQQRTEDESPTLSRDNDSGVLITAPLATHDSSDANSSDLRWAAQSTAGPNDARRTPAPPSPPTLPTSSLVEQSSARRYDNPQEDSVGRASPTAPRQPGAPTQPAESVSSARAGALGSFFQFHTPGSSRQGGPDHKRTSVSSTSEQAPTPGVDRSSSRSVSMDAIPAPSTARTPAPIHAVFPPPPSEDLPPARAGQQLPPGQLSEELAPTAEPTPAKPKNSSSDSGESCSLALPSLIAPASLGSLFNGPNPAAAAIGEVLNGQAHPAVPDVPAAPLKGLPGLPSSPHQQQQQPAAATTTPSPAAASPLSVVAAPAAVAGVPPSHPAVDASANMPFIPPHVSAGKVRDGQRDSSPTLRSESVMFPGSFITTSTAQSDAPSVLGDDGRSQRSGASAEVDESGRGVPAVSAVLPSPSTTGDDGNDRGYLYDDDDAEESDQGPPRQRSLSPTAAPADESALILEDSTLLAEALDAMGTPLHSPTKEPKSHQLTRAAPSAALAFSLQARAGGAAAPTVRSAPLQTQKYAPRAADASPAAVAKSATPSTAVGHGRPAAVTGVPGAVQVAPARSKPQPLPSASTPSQPAKHGNAAGAQRTRADENEREQSSSYEYYEEDKEEEEDYDDDDESYYSYSASTRTTTDTETHSSTVSSHSDHARQKKHKRRSTSGRQHGAEASAVNEFDYSAPPAVAKISFATTKSDHHHQTDTRAKDMLKTSAKKMEVLMDKTGEPIRGAFNKLFKRKH